MLSLVSHFEMIKLIYVKNTVTKKYKAKETKRGMPIKHEWILLSVFPFFTKNTTIIRDVELKDKNNLKNRFIVF